MSFGNVLCIRDDICYNSTCALGILHLRWCFFFFLQDEGRRAFLDDQRMYEEERRRLLRRESVLQAPVPVAGGEDPAGPVGDREGGMFGGGAPVRHARDMR